MLLNISHCTRYSYEKPITYGLQQLRLVPKSRTEQEVLTWETRVDGGKIEAEYQDQHMNHVQLISFNGPVQEITITSQGSVRTHNNSGITGRHAGFTPLWHYLNPTPLTKAGNGVRALTKGLTSDIPDAIERLHALSARIGEAMPYEKGATHSATTAEDALNAGKGVCQDHTHVFLAAARALGYPARYASGYLKMDDGTDQTAAHAWGEAHVDAVGWIGFDVSNAICPDERYVRVATGRDYREAAPISGMHFGEGSEETLSVSIQVQQ